MDVIRLMGVCMLKQTTLQSFFLSESNHKIDFNINYVEIFYILMINMRMFVDFKIVMFCFMFSICI
jgi:hypothetical protein